MDAVRKAIIDLKRACGGGTDHGARTGHLASTACAAIDAFKEKFDGFARLEKQAKYLYDSEIVESADAEVLNEHGKAHAEAIYDEVEDLAEVVLLVAEQAWEAMRSN